MALSIDFKDIKPLIGGLLGGNKPAAPPAPVPPAPPAPTPAAAGFTEWANDPQNQQQVGHAITAPGQPIIPANVRQMPSMTSPPMADIQPMTGGGIPDMGAIKPLNVRPANAQNFPPLFGNIRPIPGVRSPSSGGSDLNISNSFADVKPLDSGTDFSGVKPLGFPGAPSELNRARTEVARLQNSGDAISQIKSPIGRGFSRAGDIALGVLAPGIAAATPGTSLHHEMLLNRARSREADALKQAAGDVDLAEKQAQAIEAAARADVLRDPRKAGDPSKTVQTDDGVFQFNPQTGRYDQRVGDHVTKSKSIEEQAYEYAVSKGKNPLEAFGAVYGAKNQKDATLPQQYLDAIQSGDTVKANLIKRTIQETQTQPKIDVHAAGERPPRQMVYVDDGKGGMRAIEVTPGMTIPTGASKTPDGKNKISSDEQKRADLAQNLNENIDTLEEILSRRPDLFGPVAGRWTQLRNLAGTDDPDVAQLMAIEHQLGMVAQGAHGMRSAQGVESAARSLTNGFRNSPAATRTALEAARKSVGTFLGNSQSPGQPRYTYVAVGSNNHEIGSNDGKTWFDMQTGKKVQ